MSSVSKALLSTLPTAGETEAHSDRASRLPPHSLPGRPERPSPPILSPVISTQGERFSSPLSHPDLKSLLQIFPARGPEKKSDCPEARSSQDLAGKKETYRKSLKSSHAPATERTAQRVALGGQAPPLPAAETGSSRRPR